MIDPETTDADLFPQMPLYHGYNFTGMFDADKAMSLENRIVRQYLFDGAIDANFVGFTTQKVGGVDEYYAPNFAGVAHFVAIDEKIANNYESTRLIGFRTTKKCKDSNLIKSIQPIYYSKNKDICQTVLRPVSKTMMSEPQEYGNDCFDAMPYATLMNDIIRETHVVVESENKTSKAVGEHFTYATFIVVWVILISLVALLIMQICRFCSNWKESQKRKAIELVKTEKSPAAPSA